MQRSARVFNCARCHGQVVICSHCDRGNLYCGKRCSQTARRQSQREAARRYRSTRRARLCHAERQRRYRQRRTTKVTHQGSPAGVAVDTLPAESSTAVRASLLSSVEPGEGIACHFCGQACSALLRRGFVHRRAIGEPIEWPGPGWAHNADP